MKKVKIVNILWVILIITTMVSVVYHIEMRTTKSLVFASGLVSLYLLLELYSAYVTKRTYIGIARDVVKKKDPKAFKGYLISYTILLLLALIVFVHNLITLIK